ncbi:MAG: sulfatase-like hydrolase/transferase, partial [Planctomycetota bacterium]
MSHDRPNILFIFADQMQAFAMGCMGNPEIQTPHLDALAADGVLFRNAYSDSPVCTPYRGCLMTGRYAAQTGIRWNNDAIPDGERCLGHFLNDAGYASSYVGKWHLGASGNTPVPPEWRAGFEHFAGYQCYNSFVDGVCFFDEDGNGREFDTHRTTATTDLALERMAKLADRPFAQFISYQNPHYPLEPSPGFAALYAQAPVTPRPNHAPCEVYTPTGSPGSPKPREADPNFQRYGRSWEAFMRCYYAMISQLDHEVGRLIRWLRQRKLYERTLIVFTSDHGENAGSHGAMNKGDWWEESARVPLVVRAPEGLRGQVVDAPVSAGVDIWPTLAD